MSSALRLSRSLRFTGLMCALVLFTGGCGGTSHSTFDPYDGTRTLPTTQSIPHPDSLRDVTLVSQPDSVQITLDRPYSALMKKWSAQVRSDQDAFRPAPFSTFTTLRSRELALATLERNEGISSLSVQRARKRLQEAHEAYEETLVFQTQLFVAADRISGPYSPLRQRVVATLRVDGEHTYESTDMEKSEVQFSNRGNGGAYQFTITSYFDRKPDGRDLLSDSERLTLSMRPFTGLTDLGFEWRREDP